MLSEKQAAVNAEITAALERGETKRAQEATSSYTRTGILEGSFLGQILPVETVTTADLMDTMNNSLAIMCEKAPQSAPARWCSFETLPNGRYMTSSKYIIPLANIRTDKFTKDLDELRTTKLPVQQFFADDMIRRAIEQIDHKWLSLVNGILDDSDAYGIQRLTTKRQVISFADTLNRSTWADAKKLMYQGATAKGYEHMYRLRSKCALMNEATAQEWTKLNFFEYGGDGAQKMLEDGLSRDSMGGIKTVLTLKDNIIPDNWVYFFTEPEFLGHYYEFRPWTTLMKQEDTTITMHARWTGGAGIGNIAGVTLAKFNQS